MTMLETLESAGKMFDAVIKDVTNETRDRQEDMKEVFKTPEQIAQQLLVERVLQGDKAAFGEIVDQYDALMMRTAYMIILLQQ